MRALRSSLIAVLCAVALICSMAAATPPAYNYAGKIWSPSAVTAARSVPGHALVTKSQGEPKLAEPGVPAVAYRPGQAAWPAASSGTASLAAPGALSPATTPALTQAGSLPVWIGGATGTPVVTAGGTSKAAGLLSPPAAVSVRLMSRTQSDKAGLDGPLLTLEPADGGTVTGTVSVRLGYAAFAAVYGGAWATRLRLVELPACALTTPPAFP